MSPGILFMRPPSTKRDPLSTAGTNKPGREVVALSALHRLPRSKTVSSADDIFTAQQNIGSHKSSIFFSPQKDLYASISLGSLTIDE